MASTSQAAGSSVTEKMREFSTKLWALQDEFATLTRFVEEENARLRAQLTQAESHNKELLNSAKWLRVQNAELERKLEAHKPEMENALLARDDAIKKLRHLRKVARDLLDERFDFKHEERLNLPDINKALDAHSEEGDDSPTTDSDKTVRLHQAGTPLDSVSGNQNRELPDIAEGEESTSFHSDSTESTHLSLRPPSPGDEQVWQIHYIQPPGCVQASGPTELDPEVLNLSPDTLDALQSLDLAPDLGMRVLITDLPYIGEVAFIYDPIFLETRGTTILMDYGTQKSNQEAGRYISQTRDSRVFHTFSFPLSQRKWFYFGALNWTLIEPKYVWSTLPRKSRQRVTKKLQKRTKGQMGGDEIARRLDSNELVEFCVELSEESAEMSAEFDRHLKSAMEARHL